VDPWYRAGISNYYTKSQIDAAMQAGSGTGVTAEAVARWNDVTNKASQAALVAETNRAYQAETNLGARLVLTNAALVAADAVVSNALSSRLEATNAVLEARIEAATGKLYRIREVLVGTNLTTVTTTNGLDLTVTVSRPTNEAVWFLDTYLGSNIVYFVATNGVNTGWTY
jgi:hypothetical protein